MHSALTIAQIVTSVLLAMTILLQQRGTGLGGAFGGAGSVYRSQRGVERALHIATIVLAAAFVGVALASVIVQ